DSDISLYGSESDFDVYSISDRFYFKAKFIQNPDSIFSMVQNKDPEINPDLARYYFQLYLERSVQKEPLTFVNQLISQYCHSFSLARDTVFIQELRTKMGVEESLATDSKSRNIGGVEASFNQLIRQESTSLY